VARIPSSFPDFSPRCNPRLPEAALAFRRQQAPPLTGLAELGAMNITAWLYRDERGVESIQVNPNITMAQLRQQFGSAGHAGCRGRHSFRGPGPGMVSDASPLPRAPDLFRTHSVREDVRADAAQLFSWSALVLLLRSAFMVRRQPRRAGQDRSGSAEVGVSDLAGLQPSVSATAFSTPM
jgi:hypothetical protein